MLKLNPTTVLKSTGKTNFLNTNQLFFSEMSKGDMEQISAILWAKCEARVRMRGVGTRGTAYRLMAPSSRVGQVDGA